MEQGLQISASQEDYLKLIWYLAEQKEKASIQRVAVLYGVRPPTVSAMFRHLQKSGLIRYDKNSGACLTETGQRMARKMVRKHRLVETFLKEVLRLDEGILHEEAERLEHVVSDRLMNRMDAYLGFPRSDPHGSPIPAQEEESSPQALKKLRRGQSFRPYSTGSDGRMKKYYEQQGFLTDSLWTLQEKAPDQSSFLVTDGRRFLAIDGRSAEHILVFIQK